MQEDFNRSMEEIFHSLKNTGLQRETFHENISWEEYMRLTEELTNNDSDNDDAKALKNLLRKKASEEDIDKVSLHDLLSKDFLNARDTIDKMTIAKRIQLLEELKEYRLLLYDSAAKWGQEQLPREEQLSAKAYRAIMGRIKHLEIIMGWLFGI